jgi:hypothetical protein
VISQRTFNKIYYQIFGVKYKRELTKEAVVRLEAVTKGEDAYTATSVGKFYKGKYHAMSGVYNKNDTIVFGRR